MRSLLGVALAIAAIAAPGVASPVFYTGSGGILADFDPGTLTPGVTTFTIPVPDTGIILGGLDNVQVQLIGLQHTFASDLEILLTYEPSGAAQSLFNQIGLPDTAAPANFNGNYSFASSFTDDLWAIALSLGDVDDIPALNAFPTSFGSASPNNFSSVFAGLSPAGTWRLTIIDHAPGDTGELLGWQLGLDIGPAAVPEPRTALLAFAALAFLILRSRTYHNRIK
jgi:subtilisin-like proprotein convertase family protein